MEVNKGFLTTLFDFTFTSFVTTKLIKLLYVIGLIFATVGAIVFIVGGFRINAGLGVLALLVSPVIFLIYSLLIRVYLEIIIVIFRIAEDVRVLAGGKSESDNDDDDEPVVVVSDPIE